MSNVLIFHGTGGHPLENWFPWLKGELEKKGCPVFIPQFPHPKDHPLSDWLDVFKDYERYLNEETILIGHSLGGIFLLRVLERLTKRIKAAFFVATPIGIGKVRYYMSDFKFSGFEFDFEKIKRMAKYFKVYHSDNDPYVSLENGQQLAQELGVKLTFIPAAGHLNAESGYTKFDLLLENINQLLKKESR